VHEGLEYSVSANIQTCISIVEKASFRSLSRQTLGFIIHNHLNSRIHFCWSVETGTFKYKDCIKGSFVREKDWLSFGKALQISSVVG